MAFDADLIALLPRLRRFAAALAGSRADGDDLVQTAMERALIHKDRYEDGTRLDLWLFRIVRNAFIDQTRVVRRRPVAPIEDAETLAGNDGPERMEQRLMLNATLTAMKALPEEQRAVLALVALDERSYRETAEALGIPIRTVMSRLARARAAIAAAIGGM